MVLHSGQSHQQSRRTDQQSTARVEGYRAKGKGREEEQLLACTGRVLVCCNRVLSAAGKARPGRAIKVRVSTELSNGGWQTTAVKEYGVLLREANERSRRSVGAGGGSTGVVVVKERREERQLDGCRYDSSSALGLTMALAQRARKKGGKGEG